ncbi:hypothetical protein C2E25_06600 [Geothermobacter hydrogeniphilus]|uniref:Carboxypeptidase regulatory-like domain-containing protein n=1 Tax=Geothermobacter hydrogeniphilus TaxID=1969733 RepID=A0A2K2HBA2_9BACT|nr:hypothetical protein [Geothermobacter hydrogeniphilus]PNU20541.1 hypothetical protein C2E25_06600 [Geothermobacter hydrogeniphilus]
MRRIFLLFLTCLLLTGCQRSGPSGLSGELQFDDKPLAGASVEIYLKADKDRSVQPFAVTTTDGDGRYRLELPPGRYFVIGKQRRTAADGRPQMLMAECPANPLEVTTGMLEVPTFSLREMGRDGRLVADADTSLAGRVTRDGVGVAGAFVYVYTEAGVDLMGPSYGAAVETDADGRFRVALPAGEFWLAARKHLDGSRLGEPKPGDLTGSLEQNPVHLAAGQNLDLGEIRVRPVDAARYRQRQRQGRFALSDTALTGKVVDEDGAPVPGIYVFAYLDSRMVGKPTYISAPSAADGSYRLNLGRGGAYYIGARSAYGGPLEPGEWVGTYDEQPEHRIDVDTGRVVELPPLQVREVW